MSSRWNIKLFAHVWILLECFCLGRLHSQSDELSFQHITTTFDGLDSQYHIFIKKDTKGFVWISSLDGVFRYDGLSLQRYIPSKENGMLGSNVQGEFFEDEAGDIWFSTLKGINRYRYYSDSFKSYQIRNPQGDLIENDYCLFYLERDSLLWLEAEGSIYTYNPYTQTTTFIVETAGAKFSVDTLATGEVSSIIACLWRNGLGIEYIQTDSLGEVSKSLYLDHDLVYKKLGPLTVSNAFFQQDSLIWNLTNQGLVLLNLYRPNTPEPFKFPYTTRLEINDGWMVNNRYLWIASKYEGLYIFDTYKRDYIDHITHKETSPHALTSNSILEVYLDPDEFVWVSNRDHSAIDYSWLRKHPFYRPFQELNIAPPRINSIVEDAEGRIWCATEQNGIWTFSSEGNFLQQIAFPSSSDTRKGFPLRGMSFNQQGELWIANDSIVYKKGPSNWESKYKLKKGNIRNFIQLSDSSKLIATNRGVLVLTYSPSPENTFIKAQEVFFEKNRINAYQFFKIDQAVYARSETNELFTIGYDGKKWLSKKRYEIDSYVSSICENLDPNFLYLGTSTGIQVLNLEKGTTQKVLLQAGIDTEKPILNLFKDYVGRIWFTSNNTLFTYEPKANTLSHYSQEEGLSDGQFLYYSSLQASDGKLWIGSHEGFTCFHPDSITPFPIGPKVFLQSLYVNREIFPLDTSIHELSRLSLDYDENTLEFEVKVLGNYLANNSRVAYRLLNYNDQWTYLNNRSGGKIEFNKVNPGKYTLEVFGINANGVSGATKFLSIVIAPPIWQETWFILLCVLGTGFVAYRIFKYSVNQKLKKQQAIFDRQQEIQGALEDERTRIAEEMHDDLGSGLNSIRLILNRVKAPNLSKDIEFELDRIENYANHSIENMQEIIWAMNSSNDSLAELIAFTRIYVLEFFEDHQLNYHSNMPENVPDLQISGEKRRNIFLCVKEGAHNVLKHAQASQVYLHFSIGDQLSISLRDNGKGIELNQIRKGANGLKNMKKRIEKIGGEMDILNQNGTLLSFHIPLEHLKQSAMNTN